MSKLSIVMILLMCYMLEFSKLFKYLCVNINLNWCFCVLKVRLLSIQFANIKDW